MVGLFLAVHMVVVVVTRKMVTPVPGIIPVTDKIPVIPVEAFKSELALQTTGTKKLIVLVVLINLSAIKETY